MFKTYSSSSSLVITFRWFTTSRLRAPVSARLTCLPRGPAGAWPEDNLMAVISNLPIDVDRFANANIEVKVCMSNYTPPPPPQTMVYDY